MRARGTWRHQVESNHHSQDSEARAAFVRGGMRSRAGAARGGADYTQLEPTEGFEPSSHPYRGRVSDHDHQVGTARARSRAALVGTERIELSAVVV